MVNIHPKAALALRAVELRKICGRHAAARFARNNGVSALYRLACQLAAVPEFLIN